MPSIGAQTPSLPSCIATLPRYRLLTMYFSARDQMYRKRRVHKKVRPPTGRPLCESYYDAGRATLRRRGAVLLQLVGDGLERVGQVGAHCAEHGDGGKRNQKGGQNIIPGGGAPIVRQQTVKK